MRHLLNWLRRQLFHRFISIRIKLIACLTAVILLFVGIALYTAYSFVIATSRQELASRATLWIHLAKGRLNHLVMLNDSASINRSISQMQQDNPELLYILVFDKERTRIGSTFGSEDLPPHLTAFSPDSATRLITDTRHRLAIREISTPLMAGAMGYVTVGFNESIVTQRGKLLLRMMIYVFALFLIPTLIVAFSLSYFITHPISRIMKTLETFTPGQTLPEIKILFNDEIRQLGLRFREMTNRLNTTSNEFKKTQLRMIETEKLASIGTLASGVAHEINNPIAGIEICAHRLQKHHTLDEKQEEYIKLITDATRHIKTIVRNLLAYARQPDQNIEQVDLTAVTKFALKLLHYRLQKKSITVVEQLLSGACNVWGIRAQLVQVIINGIINAVDASHNEGTITISIVEAGAGFTITIADNGAGLDESVAGKVFDPFFTTKGSEGTGLGLYVSYNIVTAHNGTISLASQEQGGAKLTITLPKAGEDGAEKPRIETIEL